MTMLTLSLICSYHELAAVAHLESSESDSSVSVQPPKQKIEVNSDGLSLRPGPGSARARHLEGLLKLRFFRLNPSIGWVKPQTQA